MITWDGKRRHLLAILLAAAITLPTGADSVVPVPREMYEMFGIIITNCVRTTRGIKVDFWTAHEPPYFVGVYPSMDWIAGGYIEEVATTCGSAFIPGDYTDLPVYVEAILPSRISQLADYCGPGTNLHSKLTAEQTAFFRECCNYFPKAATVHSVRILMSPPVRKYSVTATFPRYYGIQHDGITVSYPSAQTAVSFAATPVPGSAAGEENLSYWPQSTYSGATYDPHSSNLWCLWSSNSVPQFLMYRDGPMYRINVTRTGVNSPVVTNTIEELREMARAGVKSVTYDIGGTETSSISLERGTLFNTRGSSYTPVAATWSMIPSWQEPIWGPVTNTYRHAAYDEGWGLRPFNYSTNAPAREILWVDENHDTNTSNRIFLPGLFKNIDTDGPVRTAQDKYGAFIIVTNTPSHWESDFGIKEIPPGSNNLFRIHYTPGDEPSSSQVEQVMQH